MSTFNFVLAGTGNMAKTYINAVRNIPDAAITGIISRSKENAKKKAAELHIADYADDLKKISAEYQAVLVATPNGLHHVTAVQAAGLGKHILTEKPIDITIKNIDKMLNAAAANKVKIGVAYQYRMKPDSISLKRIFSEKKCGKIYGINLLLNFYRGQEYYESALWRGTKRIDGGGPFLQQGSHNIDLLYWYFGMPEKVFAKTGTFGHRNIEVEDHGSAILEFPDKSIAALTASTLAKPGFHCRMEIFTEKGTIITENDCITFWGIDGLPNPAAPAHTGLHSAAASVAVNDTSGHEAIIKDFIHAIREDREPAVNGPDAKKSIEVILAIYRSAQKGKEVSL